MNERAINNKKIIIAFYLIGYFFTISFYITYILKRDTNQLVSNLQTISQFILMAGMIWGFESIAQMMSSDKKLKPKIIYPNIFFIASISILLLPYVTFFENNTLLSDFIAFILYLAAVVVSTLILTFNILKFKHKIYAFLTLFWCIVIIILQFSVIYSKYGIIDSNGVISNKYLDGLYFSIVTWSTLGYGDFRPTELLKFIAAIESIFGYIFLGLLLYILTLKKHDKKIEKKEFLYKRAYQYTQKMRNAIFNMPDFTFEAFCESNNDLELIFLGKSYFDEVSKDLIEELKMLQMNIDIDNHQKIINTRFAFLVARLEVNLRENYDTWSDGYIFF